MEAWAGKASLLGRGVDNSLMTFWRVLEFDRDQEWSNV